ncbi:hypothetical protein [Paucibacter sp. Y2R2-4]|uniref:hypothetical protein n=1 Tax=Paucibacter sp. Y2R2-4 TaxID=2893553 RepID=UPI0021E3F3E0|nr:hypothetical protein [Paucibacter sp. Y2R2-4]MCV2349669.1 hypothetical protein [Paucibacter sp. Y2R2-4]
MNIIRSSAIALACMAAIGSAHALTPAEIDTARGNGSLKEVYVSGASALRLALGGYMQELADPATFDVFYFGSTGADHRAYSFKLNKAVGSWPVGTSVLVVKKDKGGSAQGVTPLVKANDAVVAGVDGNGAGQVHMLVSGTSCVANTSNGVPINSPSTDVQKPGFICSGTQQRFAHAGLSDVEPKLLQDPVNGGTNLNVGSLNAAGFVQNVFGVAVNKSLYLALQKAQGLDNAGAIDESAAKQPSIPAGFVRGALTGQISGNLSTKKGWNLLIPSTVDAAVDTKQVNVCRRTNGSGTQAASNVYFAANPCAGGGAYIPSANTQVGGVNGTVAQVILATGRTGYFEGSSTQLVESCLGTTAEGVGAYALGIVGRENNPLANGGDKGYRFVKLGGVAPERANVIDTSYDFAFESSMQWSTLAANAPAADVAAFLTDMRNNMGKASVLAKLDPDLQAGLVALPGTYSGAWALQTPEVKAFSAHAARASGNSCTPVRMFK